MSRRTMLLRALPLIFVLTGLVLYTTLAGADFGAGFWQLFAGRGSGRSGSVSTLTDQWGRCGRPITCG